MKMPNQMTIKDRGCTMDMQNDRGSDRTCDLYVEKTEIAFFLTYSTTQGTLNIMGSGDKDNAVVLSPPQVEALVRFLQQKD